MSAPHLGINISLSLYPQSILIIKNVQICQSGGENVKFYILMQILTALLHVLHVIMTVTLQLCQHIQIYIYSSAFG